MEKDSPERVELLRSFCTIARPIMLQFLPPSACIAATRVAIDCLRELGYDAQPMATQFVFEVPSLKMAYAVGLSDEQLTGAESIVGEVGEGWKYHLVARVDKTWLLDASFDQVAPALKGDLIEKECAMFPLNEDTADTFHAVYNGTLDGPGTLEVNVHYGAIADDGWKDTPAWNDEGLSILTEVILHRMKQPINMQAEDRPTPSR